MANTRITTEFATIGADRVVSAMSATDAALLKSTEAARKQTDLQKRQADGLRKLRDAERDEQQQLKQAAGIIQRATTAEEKHAQETKALELAKKRGLITQQKYNQLVGQSRTAHLGATGSMSSMIAGLGQTALAITGVGSAVGVFMVAARAIRAEWQNLLDAQKSAADKSVSFEDALTETRFNTSKFFSSDEAREISLDVAGEAGITPTRAAKLFGSTVTSTGVQTREDAERALQATTAAAKLRPDLPDDELASLGAAAGSLSKEFNITPEAAIGFVNVVGQQANIDNLDQQIQNIVPVLAAGDQNGLTAAESGALFAIISQKGFDTEGATTRTAVSGFLTSLRTEFAGNKDLTRDDGSLNLLAALDHLRDNPELGLALLRGTKDADGVKHKKIRIGKGNLATVFEQLLLGQGNTRERFDKAIPIIGDFDDGATNYEELLRENEANNTLSNTRRRFESTTAIAAVTNTSAISGIIRDNLPQLQQAFGDSATAQTFEKIARELESDFGTDAAGASEAAIRDIQRMIEEAQAKGGDRNEMLVKLLLLLIEQLKKAAEKTEDQVQDNLFVTADTGDHERDAYRIADEQIEEVLSGVIDPAYRDYLRKRAAARHGITRQDPRDWVQDFAENHGLHTQREKYRILDPEQFARDGLEESIAHLSPYDQKRGRERFAELKSNSDPDAHPFALLEFFIKRFKLDEFGDQGRGDEVLESLHAIARNTQTQAEQQSTEPPFLPEASPIPHATAELSGGFAR